MRRVEKGDQVTVAEAKRRLERFRKQYGSGPHRAATLADVIWPRTQWRAAQGAGAAASRMLKRLGYRWVVEGRNWGWKI